MSFRLFKFKPYPVTVKRKYTYLHSLYTMPVEIIPELSELEKLRYSDTKKHLICICLLAYILIKLKF